MDSVILSFAGLSVLLLAGKLLRVKVKLLRQLYLPSSVIAGLIGLFILQVYNATTGATDPAIWVAGWTKIPGLFINVVFAALFLGVAIPPLREIWNRAASQLAYGQIVAWGQYTVGVGTALFILGPLFGVAGIFGVIVPVGFEGGHGTAGGLMPTFEEMGMRDLGDYALSSATAGILLAIVVGVALINWAARSGHAKNLRPISSMSEQELAGIYPVDRRPKAGDQTVSADSVDSLALHLAIIGVAILIGYGFKLALIWLEAIVTNGSSTLFQGFPLFPLCMVGGLLLQLLLQKSMRHPPIDHQLMQRIAGTALDFLVVAAIATIRLEVVVAGLIPFLIIIAAAVAWNIFCVLWLAPRLLPSDWFERAIAEMGQSMGVTATGLLLLRVVDPESKTTAPSAFGYKQLLHEPFMGGGLWTSTAIILFVTAGAGVVFGISVAAIATWLVVWWLVIRPGREAG